MSEWRDGSSVLDELADLAQEHGWDSTAGFVRGIGEPADPTILLLASPGAGGDELTNWIIGVAPSTAAVTQADLASSDVDQTLRYNRVMVAHSCGAPLTATEVEIISAIRARPGDTYLVVLTDATEMSGPEDLETVQRNIWRLLVDPDEAAAKPDLAAQRFVLWSDTPVQEFLAERLGRDVEIASDWVRAAPAAREELAIARAVFALDLAEQEAQRQPRAERAEDSAMALRRLELAQEAARDGRAMVANRLRLLSTAARTRIGDALRSLEAELIRGVPEYLARSGSDRPAGAAASIDGYLEEGLRRWHNGRAAQVLADIERQSRSVPDVFDEVAWETINRALGTGATPFPRVNLQTVQMRLGLDNSQGEQTRTRYGDTRQDRAALNVRGVVIAGALGAAVGFGFGGPMGGAVGAAVGMAGSVALQRISTQRQQDRDRFAGAARQVIQQRISHAVNSLPAAIDSFVDPVARMANEEFDAVDAALDAARDTARNAVGQAAQAPGSTSEEPSRQLSLLRGRLSGRPSTTPAH